ncbi:MAG: 4Fe-4S binding protein [candidate division KSB1 bacterium]|nr:4Fe-4S binding protein [candidate division KSB1 bacterium]
MTVSSGKQQRLNRLFDPRDGRAVCVAADHGWMSDPTENVIRLKTILQQVVEGGADGVLMSFGTAQRLGSFFHGREKPALLIRADWMNLPRLGASNVSNVLPVVNFRKRATSRAQHALAMGASAITIYYFIGYSDEFEALNVEQAAAYARECRRIGLPLIIEPMAVGGMVTGVNIAEILIASARIAFEIGADALKIPYTGDVHTFRELCRVAQVPVLVLGGAKSDHPRDALELVEEALRAGAAGTVFGRNVTKAKDPKKMVQDIVALVHGGKTVDEITNPLHGKRIRLGTVSSRCTGCDLCLLACTGAHNGGYGHSGARLRVEHLSFLEGKPAFRPFVCTLCGRCVTVCRTGALSYDERGIIRLDRVRCDRCLECQAACPFRVIGTDAEGYPVICDLCDGNPQCVRWCKYDAIVALPREPIRQERGHVA